jgi:hypothetical protein
MERKLIRVSTQIVDIGHFFNDMDIHDSAIEFSRFVNSIKLSENEVAKFSYIEYADEILLDIYRPETDEEMNARIKEHEKEKKRREKKLAELKRLMLKYPYFSIKMTTKEDIIPDMCLTYLNEPLTKN